MSQLRHAATTHTGTVNSSIGCPALSSDCDFTGVTTELEKSLQESVSQTSHTHSMDEIMVTNTVVPMSTRDDQRHGPDHTTKTKLPKSVPDASPHQATGPTVVA